MKTSESIVKIVPALLKAQKAMGAAKKDAENPYYKHNYADLGSVMEVCKMPLNDNGIVVLQPVINTVVETTLIHESGEWMTSETPIVCATQNDPQKLGSAISYARRYGLQSMLFIPAVDDDAEIATTHEAKPTPTGRPYYSATGAGIVTPPGVQTGATIKATGKQVQLIAILLSRKGQADEDLKKKYNVASKKDLSMVQASQIIDNLNKLPDYKPEV